MLRALQTVAEQAPHLQGPPLLDALVQTGWVDGDTARRLLPTFVNFDPDRHFAEHLRALSFRGRIAESEFRQGVRCVFEELIGGTRVDDAGPEAAIRFVNGNLEGFVLAHPEVSFTVNGATRDAVLSAVEEMPDTIVLVARNFQRDAAAQLSGLLAGTEVPGTLVTVNLLLGMRAMALRYDPGADRVVRMLAAGRPLRSADIARLGERRQAAAGATA